MATPLASAAIRRQPASQPAGRLARQARSQRSARSGSAARQAASRSVHALVRRRRARRRPRKNARTSSGTRNCRLDAASRGLLRQRTSSAPSGSPWRLAVSCLFGEPKPMCVRTAISDGSAVSAFAAAERRVDGVEVVAVGDALHVPAVRVEALARRPR